MFHSHFTLLLFAPLSFSPNFALLSVPSLLSLPRLFLSLPYNCVCSSVAVSSVARICQPYTITDAKDKNTGPKVNATGTSENPQAKRENAKEGEEEEYRCQVAHIQKVPLTYTDQFICYFYTHTLIYFAHSLVPGEYKTRFCVCVR